MGNTAYTFLIAHADQSYWNVYYECPVYKVFVPVEVIDHYLPKRLDGFSANTYENYINRLYFYAEENSMVTRTLFDDYIDGIPFTVSLRHFLQKLSKEKDPMVRYNFVITDNHLIFIRVPHFTDRNFRLRCKHITISSRAPSVRYAGEIWHDEQGNFVINNSSGTYRPADQLVSWVTQLFNYLSPNICFQGITFRDSF